MGSSNFIQKKNIIYTILVIVIVIFSGLYLYLNNKPKADTGTRLPNLVVSDISVPNGPSSNTTLTFTITVQNIGDSTTGASATGWAELQPASNGKALKQAGFTSDCQLSKGGQFNVPALNAGGKTKVSIKGQCGTIGEHILTVEADTANYVTESDEDDNVSSKTFSLLGPDLTIGNFSPTTAKANKPFTINATVKNVGYGNSAATSLRLTAWDSTACQGGGDVVVPAIAKGQQKTVKYKMVCKIDNPLTQSINPSLTFTVNPDLTVIENDKAPNSATITLIISK